MAVDESFVEFVHARSAALLRTAYLLTGDHGHAEDLVQSSLLAAYRSWSRIRDPAATEAYVRRILVRRTLSWRQRRWRSELITGAVPEQPGRDEPQSGASHDSLWPLVLQLSERQRAVVVLTYYEDMAEAEVARLLGCSGTVKSHRARALRALRERLAAGDAAELQGDRP